jgi:F-type H+-transporting ATPase subunit a
MMAAALLASAARDAEGQAPTAQPVEALAVAAQEAVTAPVAPAQAAEEHSEDTIDILHHILDDHQIELPFIGYVQLPAAGSWMLGPIDITPTKYVVWVWVIGLLMLAIFIPTGIAAKRARQNGAAPKGSHNAVEAIILFFRDQVIMPNVGHGGEKYVPFVVSLFFFILIGNLLGMIPYGAAATANISVTAALAIMSFIVIETAGMQALGPIGYARTIFYWNENLPIPLRLLMALILTPVELLGKLSKPFALAVRLMANMTAGKVVLYAMLGLIFLFGSWAIAVAPVAMIVVLSFLKIFVAFLQAYVFSLLVSVFIGLISHSH